MKKIDIFLILLCGIIGGIIGTVGSNNTMADMSKMKCRPIHVTINGWLYIPQYNEKNNTCEISPFVARLRRATKHRASWKACKNMHYRAGLQYTTDSEYVKRVIDGDTLVLQSGEKIRLSGIDTPEWGEKGYGAATRALMRLVFSANGNAPKLLIIQRYGCGKYGRTIADLWVGSIHINQYMLDKRFAVPYR